MGRGVGGGVGKCVRVWGEVKKDVWGVGSVLACGEKNGGGVEKCVRMWGPNTLPHISSLTSPFPTSPLTSPTPQHTFLHLPLIPLPTSPFLTPHPNTFSYYPHNSPHLLKVWRSYYIEQKIKQQLRETAK